MLALNMYLCREEGRHLLVYVLISLAYYQDALDCYKRYGGSLNGGLSINSTCKGSRNTSGFDQ